MKKMNLLAALLVGGVVSAAEQSKEAPIFGDNFDTPAALSEKWSFDRGVKKENGSVVMPPNSKLNMKQKMPEEFRLSVRIKLIPVPSVAGAGGDWVGIVTFGPFFILRRHGGAQLIYRKPGEKQTRGLNLKINGFDFDKFYMLTVIREQTGGDQPGSRWTYLLDGKKVGEAVTANPPENAKLGIWVIGKTISAAVDDFQITEIKKAK